MDKNFYKVVQYTENMFLNNISLKTKSLIKAKKIIRKILARSTNLSIYNWKNCLLALSLVQSYKNCEDDRILVLVTKYVNDFVKKVDIQELDTSIMGEVLLELRKIYKTKKFDNEIKKIYEFIKNAPTDGEGSKIYRPQSDSSIFADMIGMICPFLFQYAEEFNDYSAKELAECQIDNFLKNAIDVETGLFYHGYNLTDNICYGIIGWGRAEGWVMRGLVESLNKYRENSDEKYLNFIRNHFKLYDKYIINDKYLSWQLSCMNGHIDTSAMSMILCSANACAPYLEDIKIFNLRKAFSDFDDNGQINSSSSECLGFSMYPQDFNNNSFGQAFYLMSLCSME